MIWDINTRLFHLFLIILIVISILSIKLEYYIIHEISGLTLLSVLVFRFHLHPIVWSFFDASNDTIIAILNANIMHMI